MKISFYLIRHGKTAGNLDGRYVGRTDEGLCDRGKHDRENIRDEGLWPRDPDLLLFSSPMRRCRESARILFPGKPLLLAEGMQECDFGQFEYKNYQEMHSWPAYQRWIDSGGKSGFPGGESLEAFKSRIRSSFEDLIRTVIEEKEADGIKPGALSAALVCHGGSIMALMDAWGLPRRTYFDWQYPAGGGCLVELDAGDWQRGRKILRLVREERP